MKWNFKRDIFALSLLVVFIIISLYYYAILPQTVPTHFNADGVANNYSSKTSLICIGISIAVSLYILLTFIPRIDPFKKKIESKYDSFLMFRDIGIAFIVIILVMTYMSAKNGSLRTDILGIAFGVMFILLGNYLPRLPRNFFFGIRSPWTLASEIVWVRTHRISGIWFVVAGILLIILNLLKVKLHISLLVVLTPTVLYCAILYPYFLYRKLEKQGKLDKNML
jgi:uncharacterized membrane protein